MVGTVATAGWVDDTATVLDVVPVKFAEGAPLQQAVKTTGGNARMTAQPLWRLTVSWLIIHFRRRNCRDSQCCQSKPFGSPLGRGRTRLLRPGPSSAVAADRYIERATKLSHPGVGKAPDTFREYPEGNAFDRVQVDYARPRHGVVAWFENNLTSQATDVRGARCDEGP